MFQKERRQPRRDQFKKGVDGDEARRKREESLVMARRNLREEQSAKRRTQPTPGTPAAQPIREARPRDPHVEERIQKLPQYRAAIYSQDSSQVHEAVVQLRRLLSIERDPPIQEVIDAGIVPKLVEFLGYNGHANLQFEAAWALTNIASGTSAHTQVVVDAGAVPLFIALLQSPVPDVREQAVWALGNIAGDSPACRDLVLSKGALQSLLAVCESDRITMLRNATWTLSNFCRGKPQPAFESVAPALPTLARLLHSPDDEVVTDACWALSYLSDDTGANNQRITAVLHQNVARRLVELLMHRNGNIVTPALRAVGNIVTGDDFQTQAMLNCNVLPVLLALLNNPKRLVRKEACWTISNITAGNPDQIRAVIEANIIPTLVRLLSDAEFEIKKEAAWAISNATSGGNAEQITYLVAQGVIKPLCDLFTCNDSKITIVALEGIENILKVGHHEKLDGRPNRFARYVEECRGIDGLEALQRHESPKVIQKAQHIMSTYFDLEDATEDVEIAPEASDRQFHFQGAPGAGVGGYRF